MLGVKSERKLFVIILIACCLSMIVATNVSADMFWKEYNGHFMPDINQNQDFDNAQVRTEENDPSISYQGTWTTILDPGASGGKRNYADHPASCTFSFTGSSIKWIDTKAWNRGISEVWIDGNLMTTVDLYDPNVVNQVVLYSNSSLSSGPHTIQIKSTNTKNPSSLGYLTSNDAFDVDDIEHEYCAPVAEANSLWWLDKRWEHIEIFTDPINGLGYIGGDVNGDGIADILDFVQELAWYKDTNGQRTGIPHTGTTVLDEQIGIHNFLVDYRLDDKLYEHTVWDSDFPDPLLFFHFLEDEVYRCQDVKLDLGFWHVDHVEGHPGNWLVWWSRRGGHAVTVAGVDSQNLLFAVSDPDNDAAEAGSPGVVRPGPHGYPHPPDVHNNEMFASHDIYTVGPSPSPGAKMGLLNFPWKWNLPEPEWELVGPVPSTWPEPLYESMTFTEIEAAVIVSPINVCGNWVVEPGETCDPPGQPGPGPQPGICRGTCTYCGDGIVNNGEACDDGDGNNTNACNNNCQWNPDISVVPPSWNFGGQLVCNPSAPKTFTVSNAGAANLVIGTITITGTDASQFSKQNDNCSGQTLAPSASCTVQAVFKPSSVGAKSAILRIPSNDPDENPLDVSLSGTGTQPDISVSPTTLNFAQIIVGGSSTKALTISNAGSAILSIYTIGISGTNANQFSKQNDTCSGQNIAPSGSCTVDVKFAPTSTGNKTATLSISSNDPDENPLNIPLKGKGVKVAVTSPNGGESLKSGSTYTITWQTSTVVGPVAKAVLKYTDDGGATWKLITTRPDNPGNHPWTVPWVSYVKTKCKVKVILKNASGVTLGSDTSDSYFQIEP